MTEVSFYQLQTGSLERVLSRLLERVIDRGMRAVIMVSSSERVEWLNELLWNYEPESFLPHGSDKDGKAEMQHIFLTKVEQNPNGASVLVIIDGLRPSFVNEFERCLDIFDGRNAEELDSARSRSRFFEEAGHKVTHWQQNSAGRWEKMM